jgi:hypothetical protein
MTGEPIFRPCQYTAIVASHIGVRCAHPSGGCPAPFANAAEAMLVAGEGPPESVRVSRL